MSTPSSSRKLENISQPNLPTHATSFVGRDRESAQVRQLLETTRLLTLTGAGGCGKTRLALQTAAQVASEFGDGVYWCDLASLSDPASPDQLRNILHRVMHYMRKALGHPQWILFDEDTYTFDRHINFWCDLHEFEARLKEAQSLLKSGLPPPAARPRAIECLEAAAQLWRGDFLEDMDTGEWAIFRRENLRQSFLQALLDLGQLYLAEARYADSVAAFQRAFSLDNYLEVAHRELMRAYARQGDAARAVRHFNEWRRLMREELSAEPSAETLLLYDRLRRGDDV